MMTRMKTQKLPSPPHKSGERGAFCVAAHFEAFGSDVLEIVVHRLRVDNATANLDQLDVLLAGKLAELAIPVVFLDAETLHHDPLRLLDELAILESLAEVGGVFEKR